MPLGSCIAVAEVQAGSCSSDSTPSLGTSMHCRCSCKKPNKKENSTCTRSSINSKVLPAPE